MNEINFKKVREKNESDLEASAKYVRQSIDRIKQDVNDINYHDIDISELDSFIFSLFKELDNAKMFYNYYLSEKKVKESLDAIEGIGDDYIC